MRMPGPNCYSGTTGTVVYDGSVPNMRYHLVVCDVGTIGQLVGDHFFTVM